MPSGKPRKHAASSRTIREATLQRLTKDNQDLRLLVTHRKLNTEAWQALSRIIDTLAELDAFATPLQSHTFNDGGHSAQTSVLPGVRTPSKEGDRKFRHGGTYAADLEKWVLKMLKWIPREVDYRITGEQPVIRPTAPRPIRQEIRVKDPEPVQLHAERKA